MANKVHYQAQQAGRANQLQLGAIFFCVWTDFAYKQWSQEVQETPLWPGLLKAADKWQQVDSGDSHSLFKMGVTKQMDYLDFKF